MAIVNSAGCCELFAAGVCIGVYTMIVYLGAFIMELWWIIENNVQLPVPAYVLAAGYFSIFLVSLFLLAGLFLRKSNYLLGWLFVSVLFFFPECGLALFMSLQYWKLDSKGIAELAFYIVRAVVNVVCIVCVQSLYTQWKQEKAVMRRLQNLNVVTSYRDLVPSKSNGSAGPSGSASNGVASGSASPGIHRANGNAGGGSLSSRTRYATAADSEPTYIVAHNSALKRSTSSVSGIMVRAVGGGGQHHHQQGVYNAAFNGSLNGCVLGPSGVDFYAPNPALWAGPSPRSEFDASSFADLVARGGLHANGVGGGGLLNGYRSMSRSTSELNRGEPWTTNGSAGAAAVSHSPVASSGGPVDYATQSLDRPKFRRHGGRNNRWEVLDVRGFGDVTLERLPERPFQYLNRPGSVVRGNESDTSSSHSIRDIAL
ncbi:reduction in Cnn dots 6 isoform X1 [Dermacentor variabilis]|uniref:reduction in Cnn dots 6 isoform X1 n=1 Tax=Dermacentor variabilis TaxID=34621 RepID=UPI003F5B351F